MDWIETIKSVLLGVVFCESLVLSVAVTIKLVTEVFKWETKN